jgi:hypothetical protein
MSTTRNIIEGIKNVTSEGVTKDQVGLSNVTNESKSTMFTNPVFTGNIGVNTQTPRASIDAHPFVVKHLPYFSFGAGGISDEYLILTKAYVGTNINSSGVVGKIIGTRGSSGEGNDIEYLDIAIQSAYTSNNVQKFDINGTSECFNRLDKIRIDGTDYIALKGRTSGGPLVNGLFFEGFLSTVSSDIILTRVRASDSNVSIIQTDIFPPNFVTNLRIEKNGLMKSHGVYEYRNPIYDMAGSQAYTFDIPVNDEGGGGNVFEIHAMFNHYYDWAYGAALVTLVSKRGTLTLQSDIKNITSGNGGSWSISAPNATTLRITKNAGTYIGTGHGHIFVRFIK